MHVICIVCMLCIWVCLSDPGPSQHTINYLLILTYILHGRSKNDHLVKLAHFFEECVASRPCQKMTFISNLQRISKGRMYFKIMNQCLIEIKYQSVLPIILNGRQVRSFN